MLGKENVLGIMLGQVARIGIQAAYFIVLARILGVSGYGAFAAIVAAAAIAAPFSSLGTNVLMVRNVAQSPKFAKMEWARALLYSLLLGAVFSFATAGLVCMIGVVDVKWSTVFWLVATDVIGFKIVEMSGAVWQALGKSGHLIWLPPIFYIVRLVIAIALLVSQSQVNLELWVMLYAIATIPFSLIVAIYTTRNIPGQFYYRQFWKLKHSDIRDGLLFSVGISAATAYNDIDKTQLAAIDSTSSAGIYASAYKIVDMAYVPIRSIATAVYPKFFERGKNGIASTNKLARKLLIPCLALGVLAFAAVQILAPLVPSLLGEGFEETVPLIRGLSVILLIRPFSFTAGDSLTGAGNQGFRSSVQVSMAFANFCANLVLIPIAGAWGAILSTSICEIVLATTLWIRAINLERKLPPIGERDAYSATK